MKRFFILTMLVLTVFFSQVFAGDMTITKVGEWGSAPYWDLVVEGKYAYVAAITGGLDIIDVSDLEHPRKISGIDYKNGGRAEDVFVRGNYAYVADYDHGLQIFDISDPNNPFLASHTDTADDARGVMVSGNYAFVAAGEAGLEIIYVADPANPVIVGSYKPQGSTYAEDVFVKDDYAYVADYYRGLLIIDISTPSLPKEKSRVFFDGQGWGVQVIGNFAYMATGHSGLKIIDVTDPSAPAVTGGIYSNEYARDIHVLGNRAFLADDLDGFMEIDISDPLNPTELYNSKQEGDNVTGVFASGSHVYLANHNMGLKILDVSNPAAPTLKGETADVVTGKLFSISGNYAYLANGMAGLIILDISIPSSPRFVSSHKTRGSACNVQVRGKYAYIDVCNYGVEIVDISNPLSPRTVGSYRTGNNGACFFVSGNYIYISKIMLGITVLDISDPSNPFQASFTYDYDQWFVDAFAAGNHLYMADVLVPFTVYDLSDPASPTKAGIYDNVGPNAVHVVGNYAYLAEEGIGEGLYIIDVTDPANPGLAGRYRSAFNVEEVYVNDGYAFLGTDEGLKVLDVSNPGSPILVGAYNMATIKRNEIYARNNYVYVMDRAVSAFSILEIDNSTTSPRISLDRRELYIGATGAIAGGPQTVTVGNIGGGTLNWSVSVDSNWLSCSPSSGTGGGQISISVDPGALSPGNYSGAVTVSDPAASNSPQTVTVYLTVYAAGNNSAPFGEFSTPTGGSTVSGSIPVTGWALDDVGLQSVQIYRGDPNPRVYIGDAVFVEGARPDVAAAYPQYPGNSIAGWGYMLLTNYLPGNGNGTFKLHAVAVDMEGNSTALGTKTIVCDNANAVKPFGGIETPDQGGITSGSDYINWGWALSPPPNTIPTDGSTITVYIDGVDVGNPVYDVYREDIDTLFPGYNNSSGAIGYFYLDTTQYDDGVHSIHWTVTDNAGNTDGIGSRYFTIYNGAQQKMQSAEIRGPVTDSETIFVETTELGRVQVALGSEDSKGSTFALYNSKLPIGATLNRETGELSWIPGPGHLGVFPMVFIETRPGGCQRIHKVRVTVKPKY